MCQLFWITINFNENELLRSFVPLIIATTRKSNSRQNRYRIIQWLSREWPPFPHLTDCLLHTTVFVYPGCYCAVNPLFIMAPDSRSAAKFLIDLRIACDTIFDIDGKVYKLFSQVILKVGFLYSQSVKEKLNGFYCLC